MDEAISADGDDRVDVGRVRREGRRIPGACREMTPYSGSHASRGEKLLDFPRCVRVFPAVGGGICYDERVSKVDLRHAIRSLCARTVLVIVR